MSTHERNWRLLLLGQRQELRREVAHHIAVERHLVRDPEAVKHREQQLRIFGWFSKGFRSLDQRLSHIERRSRLVRREPFGVH